MCKIMEGYLAEVKAEVIVNLLSEGFSLEKIAALTNTDLAFVQEVVSK